MGAQVAKLKRFSRTPTASIKNVDKVLEQKIPAQRHPSTVEGYKEVIKDNPMFKTIVENKNDNLHKMLETVKVHSKGVAPSDILKSGKRTRKLDIIPEGKLSYYQVEELFVNRKVSPELWTVETIAEKYKLDGKVASNLLTYYSSFRIYKQPKPDDDEEDASLYFFQKDPEKSTKQLE